RISGKTFLPPKDKKVIRAQKKRTSELENKCGKYLLAPKGKLRIVLVGKIGTGKSHLGNNLINEEVFVSETRSDSVTKRCQFAERQLDKKITLFVVDSPGLFDTRDPNEQTIKEILRSIGLLEPGPHIFIFVISIAVRFTQEEADSVAILQEMFGEQVIQHVIIVFTRKDDLGASKSLNNFIKNSSPVLQNLLERCNNRFAFINNKADKNELREDVDGILDLIYKTIGENEGGYYTNDAYQKATEVLEVRTKEIRSEKECTQTELWQEQQQILEEAKENLKGTDGERFLKLTQELQKTIDENDRQLNEIEEKKQCLTQKMKEEDEQRITKGDQRQKDEDKLKQLEENRSRLLEDNKKIKLEKKLETLQQKIVDGSDSDDSRSKTILKLVETIGKMVDINQRNPCRETKKEVEEGDEIIKTVASKVVEAAMHPGAAAVSFVSEALSTLLEKFNRSWILKYKDSD
ncbi:GTPase IMAP family member 7-like, partial [Patella vulgata]|uniref:GTPase IMAP family member 7-like n=1 Tax=Patella vulgata TaxID=6465 RepID=UPI0024A90F05